MVHTPEPYCCFAIFAARAAWEDPKCLECKLLPCCHGGCHGWRWMRDGVAVCSEYRADPDSYVLGELTRLKAEQARKQ